MHTSNTHYTLVRRLAVENHFIIVIAAMKMDLSARRNRKMGNYIQGKPTNKQYSCVCGLWGIQAHYLNIKMELGVSFSSDLQL